MDATDLAGYLERIAGRKCGYMVEPVAYRLRRSCAWRECGWVLDVRSRSGLYGAFCPTHAAMLAAIRAELETTAEPAARRGRRPKALREHLAELDALLGEAA